MSDDQKPLTSAERSKRWRERYPERNRESQQRWKKANPAKATAYERCRRRDSAQTRARKRDWTLRTKHAVLGGESGFAAIWETQGGKCYLCGIYLVPERAYIDHDHRCCPPNRSCQFCRRGLTCDYCNTLIGLAHDDPDVLRLIATNLEAKLAEIGEQLSRKSSQLVLLDPEVKR